jgi:hypothetical protein
VQPQRKPSYTGTVSQLGATWKRHHTESCRDHIKTEYNATHQHTFHQQNSFLSIDGCASDICAVRLEATRRCCFKHSAQCYYLIAIVLHVILVVVEAIVHLVLVLLVIVVLE